MTADVNVFNAFEAAGWEKAATGYDRFFAPVTAHAIEPLLDAADVRSGTRVLDLATGPGYAAGSAVARGADVVGIDIAESMLEIARRRVPDAMFHRGDIERLPFADGAFDAAVGNFAILHVGRPEQVATEGARVLRTGGRLALSTWDFAERARLFGLLVEAVADVGATPPPDVPVGPSFFRFSDDDEFANLLVGGGFGDVTVQTIEFSHGVASFDELWDGLIGGTVRTRALVMAQPEDVRSDIRAVFESKVSPYRTDDGLKLPVAVKLAAGRR